MKHPVLTRHPCNAGACKARIQLCDLALVCLCTGDEGFAPAPSRMDMCLEYQAGAGQAWQTLQFFQLGVLVPQGPFVQQLEVPLGVNVKDLRLRVLDWPVYYTLDLQKLAMSNQYGQNLKVDGAFQNAVVISDIHGTDTTAAAQLLATHMAHHLALGFDQYMVYTRGPEVFEAIAGNPVTAGYMKAGLLQLITMESLQIPAYDDRRTDRTYAFHQSYDPMKLIAYNHAALTLWGERFHLAVLDPDEFWSSHGSHSRVDSWFDTCFPEVDLIKSTRVEVVCNNCRLNGGTEISFLQQHWNESNPSDVLKYFNKVVTFSQDPKSIFWPDKVGQVWLHTPFLYHLPGSRVAAVSIDESQAEVVHANNCVYVVHLYNLFNHRIPNDIPSVYNPLRWLGQ